MVLRVQSSVKIFSSFTDCGKCLIALFLLGLLMTGFTKSVSADVKPYQSISVYGSEHEHNHQLSDSIFHISCGHCAVALSPNISDMVARNDMGIYSVFIPYLRSYQLRDNLFKPPKR